MHFFKDGAAVGAGCRGAARAGQRSGAREPQARAPGEERREQRRNRKRRGAQRPGLSRRLALAAAGFPPLSSHATLISAFRLVSWTGSASPRGRLGLPNLPFLAPFFSASCFWLCPSVRQGALQGSDVPRFPLRPKTTRRPRLPSGPAQSRIPIPSGLWRRRPSRQCPSIVPSSGRPGHRCPYDRDSLAKNGRPPKGRWCTERPC